ncbi:myb family transcription factor PHL8-like [Mercurialis annua]|uniref:myb family transcription factor PHL8-like n=1 Tax=Mercurialis annua TaxID=3986 RepID=UPI00215E1162|nr:myb family transcription factor PHL8-like [Mercurialis annua]
MQNLGLNGLLKATPKIVLRMMDYKEIQSTQGESKARIAEGIRNPIDESFQIAQALEMKKEVQRKLHEQIEVQVVGLLCRIPEK